jgi:predicted small secreted protein
MRNIFKITFLGLFLISFIFLTGCQNTMAGFGTDMKQNGQKIENSAHNND